MRLRCERVLMRYLLLSFFMHIASYASTIQTFYGPLTIEDACMQELLTHPMMERLKSVHQYGVNHYFVKPDLYNRYEHSLGVLYILQRFGASVPEEIAGLLHDVSHTAFSHVGDWVFDYKDGDSSYQDDTHGWFLRASGLESVLKKHGYTIDDVHHKNKHFTCLERSLPYMCADRIEYNLQGAFYEDLLTAEEIMHILDDLRFDHDTWYFVSSSSAKKFAMCSLFMTRNCWSEPFGQICYKLFSQALKRALALQLISLDDIHFGKDDDIFYRLQASNDEEIQFYLQCAYNRYVYFEHCSTTCSFILTPKFRGIDPYVKIDDKLVFLTTIDTDFKQRYDSAKAEFDRGFGICERQIGSSKSLQNIF